MNSDDAKPKPFTIEPRQWYAAEFIGQEFGDEIRSYSPIRVEDIKPLKTGKGRFKMTFFHANYPGGVQGKIYTLQTIERSTTFMLARSTEHEPARLMLIYEITWPWLLRHGFAGFEGLAQVQDRLDRIYGVER